MRIDQDSRQAAGRRPASNEGLRLLAGSGAALAAALAAAVARGLQSFEHGWWLVAYLALVGSISQALLVSGQLALAPAKSRRPQLGWELGLWNLGVVLVPVGVLADAPALVALGSVALLLALGLFAYVSGVFRAEARPVDRRVFAYRVLLVFLAASVLVGTGLGEAFPWQWI